MTLTDRDRRIVVLVVPVLLVVAYWFLLLGPKRAEAAQLATELEQAEQQRDEAVARAQRLAADRDRFKADLADLVRVGKAIPQTLDMPSLIIQFQAAAKGTGIGFTSITPGPRASEAAAAGGAPAPADAGTAGAGEGVPATTGAGLDRVPVALEVTGRYGEIADFLHRLKRFVRVEDDRVTVRGRLVTVDGFGIEPPEEGSELTATIQTTVYLAPRTAAAATDTPSQAGSETPAPAAAPAAPAPSPASGEAAAR